MLVGVDLGTTNSLVGVWTDAGPRLVRNCLGDLLTPSAVALHENGDVLVGRAARQRLLADPRAGVTSFKRYMGTQRETTIGKRTFRPEELSALVMRQLFDDVATELGEKVTEAVISVPAYFSDAQRKATRNAGLLAGVKVERLVNEPTAAALAYGLQHQDEEIKFLVFDLGGGTFDVSILEKFEGVMEVHASAGDNFLGGDDFVTVLENAALADLGIAPDRLKDVERANLRHRLEQAKCRLTGREALDVELAVGGRDVTWRIAEPRFEELAAALLERMRLPIERALRDSKTDPRELAEIVLVGGATRMPMVARLVTRLFGRLPLRHVNPDEAVALGAVVLAGMKARHESFRDVVMTDVCPYTLGVEVCNIDATGHATPGLFSPLIERNTVVPTSRVGTYFPVQDFQKQLQLRVFQGESPRTVNNILLGELTLQLDKAQRHDSGVDVRFTYDVDGILEVDATLQRTGRRHTLVIEQNPGVLSPDDVRKRLRALEHLKVHPREQQANLAAIGRAERLYEEHLAHRDRIGTALSAFLATLETQDQRRIEQVRNNLLELIRQIEGATA